MRLIDKAIELAKNNPNCFIGYFVETRMQMADIFCETASVGAFNTERTRDRFVFHNGSKIQFIELDESCLMRIAGAIFSDAFVDAPEGPHHAHWLWILRRTIRQTDGTKSVYDRYGKYVWEAE